ncbi:hypothetical protein RR46_01850 [Papilio xuthus]|uniref:Uncharacterized protein n=1 Tax=Papilio xuthus TaxID=66420 RepID=A0A194QED3_PAPXU|nr:hypothetical protein RR46_01850 [Papilio xuthus]
MLQNTVQKVAVMLLMIGLIIPCHLQESAAGPCVHVASYNGAAEGTRGGLDRRLPLANIAYPSPDLLQPILT